MAFKLKSADAIFPTPLFQFEVEAAAKLNATLLKEIARRQAKESGTKKSNRNGWHSDGDLFERKEPAQAALAKMLLTMLAKVTRQVAPDADFSSIEMIPDGWINVNPRGGYNSPHDHPGAFWSGCYYIKVPPGEGNAGSIEFLSPHRPVVPPDLIKAPITAAKMCMRPKEGTVLIFPASVIHWVHPNDSDEERVTIAFNVRFRPKRTG